MWKAVVLVAHFCLLSSCQRHKPYIDLPIMQLCNFPSTSSSDGAQIRGNGAQDTGTWSHTARSHCLCRGMVDGAVFWAAPIFRESFPSLESHTPREHHAVGLFKYTEVTKQARWQNGRRSRSDAGLGHRGYHRPSPTMGGGGRRSSHRLVAGGRATGGTCRQPTAQESSDPGGCQMGKAMEGMAAAIGGGGDALRGSFGCGEGCTWGRRDGKQRPRLGTRGRGGTHRPVATTDGVARRHRLPTCDLLVPDLQGCSPGGARKEGNEKSFYLW